VWPLERRRDIVRVGRERVERWRPVGRRLELQDQREISLHEGSRIATLRVALAALLEERGNGPVDIVLESAWLPVLLLHVGTELWSNAKIQALLRHRLNVLYCQTFGSTDSWVLQLDNKPGDPLALGYGLAAAVRESITEAADTAGQKLASIQPAFQWAARRLKHRQGWLLCQEQDRSLVARLERGRVVALNAGAPPSVDEAHGKQLIDIEARRHGVTEPDASSLNAGWWSPWVSGTV
jgi:hypothetical protein